MKGESQIGKYLKNNLFFISAILLLFSFPYSESLLSITSGILLGQIFFTGGFSPKWTLLKTDLSIVSLSGVFLIYLIGFIFCKDLSTGLYEIQKSIFWVLIPIGVALSPKLQEKKFWLLLLLFIVFVTLGTFIVTYKIINASHFNITDVRDASFVSHISFAFQIIFSVFVLMYAFIKRPLVFSKISRTVIVLWAVWLIFFLMLQKSLLGILSFYLSGIVFAVWAMRMLDSKRHKRLLITAAIIVSLLPFVYVGHAIGNFYTIKDEMPDESGMYTAMGNKYAFKTENKQKENGHYVNWFLCKDEMAVAWDERSALSINDRDATGYQIYYTLIRYLTSKGLKKDAEGVKALSVQDIINIENGVSNYIYVDQRYSLYPRIYQTIWEIDEYRNTGNPNNQSLSQRFEYVKAALYIIEHHFWGIGTGNFKLEFANAYEQINTKLKKEFRFHVHNQYLSYMVKFGILGLLLIITMISYAIYRKRNVFSILLLCLLIVLIVSNFGEAILETHIGLPFFLFFIALLLWHSPAEFSNKAKNKH